VFLVRLVDVLDPGGSALDLLQVNVSAVEHNSRQCPSISVQPVSVQLDLAPDTSSLRCCLEGWATACPSSGASIISARAGNVVAWALSRPDAVATTL
jgi:hypothetical protein